MAYADDYRAALAAVENCNTVGAAPRGVDWAAGLRTALASGQTAMDALAAGDPDPEGHKAHRERLSTIWGRTKAKWEQALPRA